MPVTVTQNSHLSTELQNLFASTVTSGATKALLVVRALPGHLVAFSKVPSFGFSVYT